MVQVGNSLSTYNGQNRNNNNNKILLSITRRSSPAIDHPSRRSHQSYVWIGGVMILSTCAILITFLILFWSSSSSSSGVSSMGVAFSKGVTKHQQSSLLGTTSLRSKSSTNEIMMTGPYDENIVRQRIEYALWSYFAGDALSSPTHWFYGGYSQIQKYYGRRGITGYTKPIYNFPGSILNKSNMSGGGRSSGRGTDPTQPKTIIGYYINHGKQDLWDPSKEIHYHATLEAGENTLEVQLGRVLMKSIVANNGKFNAEHFRKAYINFMMQPGSHNDTYASTCHRMFFANLIYKQLPPDQCPDNDSHNVDTVDGLVLPTITALAIAGHRDGTIEEAAKQAAATAAVTRRSNQLEQYASEWGRVIFTLVRGDTTTNNNLTKDVVQQMAQALRLRTPQIRSSDEITACYLNSAVPALLDTIVKYATPTTTSIWDALLANANTGGENVHRGSCLGAVLGIVRAAAASPTTNEFDTTTSSPLITGLYHRSALEIEIQSFLQSIHK